MKALIQIKTVLIFGFIAFASTFILNGSATAANIIEADNLYRQEKFQQALLAYANHAKAGNPHAYYQLGSMYYNGQGTEPNMLNALVWYTLAAEYQLNNAEELSTQLLNNVDESSVADAKQLIKIFKERYGKQQFQKKYLPEIISTNINKRITFGGEEKFEEYIDSNELLTDDESDPFGDDAFSDDEEDQWFDSYDSDPSTNTRAFNFMNRPYLAIVDYDVAKDGSVRNIVVNQSSGRVNKAVFDLSTTNMAGPKFENKPVSFVNRSFLGVANYNSYRIKANNKKLYFWLLRLKNKLAKSNDIHDKYQLAMTLLYFDWLPQEDGEAITLLHNLAKEGYVKAQYEYGMHLYREQLNSAEAIEWITKASMFGLAKAQYRLANILQESPWVINDEKKSLFWYESAANENYQGAKLKAAELKLLAKDESLLDQRSAIALLASIDTKQNENPEFNYLVAVSRIKGESKNMGKALKHMRLAISQARNLNWDVSEWENQYSIWTEGKVLIVE